MSGVGTKGELYAWVTFTARPIRRVRQGYNGKQQHAVQKQNENGIGTKPVFFCRNRVQRRDAQIGKQIEIPCKGNAAHRHGVRQKQHTGCHTQRDQQVMSKFRNAKDDQRDQSEGQYTSHPKAGQIFPDGHGSMDVREEWQRQ